jgi:hypothetical protein
MATPCRRGRVHQWPLYSDEEQQIYAPMRHLKSEVDQHHLDEERDAVPQNLEQSGAALVSDE